MRSGYRFGNLPCLLALITGIGCGDESSAVPGPASIIEMSTDGPAQPALPSSDTPSESPPSDGPAVSAGTEEGTPPVQALAPAGDGNAGSASGAAASPPAQPVATTPTTPAEPSPTTPADPSPPAQDFPVSSGKPSAYLAGDSTVQTYGAAQAPQQGWGQRIQEFFARSKDAIAVLVTPTPRLDFSNGEFQNDFAEYCAAIQEVGADTNTPVIDLQTRGLAFYTSIGLAEVQDTISLDVLHFKTEGAFQMARLVSEGVKESVLPIGRFVQ